MTDAAFDEFIDAVVQSNIAMLSMPTDEWEAYEDVYAAPDDPDDWRSESEE